MAATTTWPFSADGRDTFTDVNDISDDEADLDATYIARSGTEALTGRNDHVRIDGPGVWIEFSIQDGIVLPGSHPHSVWRDPNLDYGGTKG